MKKFLQPERCFLLVVDPQERLMAVIHQAERVTKNISLLLNLAKILDIPLILSTQYVKGLGPYVPELLSLVKDKIFYDKIEFSCLKNSTIAKIVEKFKPTRNNMILCGVESHICVYQTALSAILKDFNVIVAADATSSRTLENMQYGLERMRDIGANIYSTEMIIYELLEKAGTESFKKMLPYLK